MVALSPAGFVAILAGWVVTEVGRQPWTVYGHLRTADSVSPVAASAVASSLALFVLVYAVLVLAFLLYASRAVRLGPSEAARGAAARGGSVPSRPAAPPAAGPGGIERGRTGARPAPDLERHRLAVFMYVLLDGFDLGVGILFPFARSRTERDQMMNSIAPIWDGNETWLVLGGGGCSPRSRSPTRRCCPRSTCR